MYLLERDFYNETKKIKCGELKMSPLLKELSEWLEDEFKVKTLNFRFEVIRISKRNKFRLSIVVDNKEDYEKMDPDFFQQNEEVKNFIALKFKGFALKHNFPINKRIKNIFVVFRDFSKEARSEANERAVKGFSEEIKSRYPNVWSVYGVFDSLIVFYYLNIDVEINKNNGVNEAVRAQYYQAVKQFDEMNYFTLGNLDMKFDSKENLDENYDGNLYSYIH